MLFSLKISMSMATEIQTKLVEDVGMALIRDRVVKSCIEIGHIARPHARTKGFVKEGDIPTKADTKGNTR